jgi:purine catabolism regulator
MARLVEAAADLAGGSVVLEDLSRRVLVSAARGEPVDRLLTDWERRSRLTPYLRTTGVGGPERWLTTPVGIQGGAWGRLVLTGPRDDSRAALVLERAAQALELGRMIERDDTAIQLRVHGGFLLDLLDDRLGGEAVAAARLRALGVPEGTSYVGAVARLREDAPADVGAAQRRMVRLSERVHQALDACGVVGLVGVLDGGHVGVLLGDDGVLDPVARELRILEPDAVLGAGQGVDRVLAAATSLRSARVVVDVGVTLPDPGAGCLRQSDIRLPGLLMSLREDARLQEFAEAELGALLEHEARHGAGLVDLLRQFLAVGGNKAELARVAHRNRTSLYPALRRLEDLVGHPLDDPASRLSLGVALLAHDQAGSLTR